MSDVRNFQQWPIAADHASKKTLHQPQNYSTAYTAATAAPAASFLPAIVLRADESNEEYGGSWISGLDSDGKARF
jgi:hypothetical protein